MDHRTPVNPSRSATLGQGRPPPRWGEEGARGRAQGGERAREERTVAARLAPDGLPPARLRLTSARNGKASKVTPYPANPTLTQATARAYMVQNMCQASLLMGYA